VIRAPGTGRPWSSPGTAAPRPLSPVRTRAASPTACKASHVPPTSCVAIGSRESRKGSSTLIESWDGTTWSIIHSPNQGTMDEEDSLSSVSCASPNNCVAVGDYLAGTVLQTLVEVWNGTTWSITPSPNPGTNDNVLRRSPARGCAASTRTRGLHMQRVLGLVPRGHEGGGTETARPRFSGLWELTSMCRAASMGPQSCSQSLSEQSWSSCKSFQQPRGSAERPDLGRHSHESRRSAGTRSRRSRIPGVVGDPARAGHRNLRDSHTPGRITAWLAAMRRSQ
jgi:hypothetical protein